MCEIFVVFQCLPFRGQLSLVCCCYLCSGTFFVLRGLESLAFPLAAPPSDVSCTSLQLASSGGSASSVQTDSVVGQTSVQQVLEMLKKRQPSDAGKPLPRAQLCNIVVFVTLFGCLKCSQSHLRTICACLDDGIHRTEKDAFAIFPFVNGHCH